MSLIVGITENVISERSQHQDRGQMAGRHVDRMSSEIKALR